MYHRPLAAFLGAQMAGILSGSVVPDHWGWVWPAVSVGIGGILYGMIRGAPVRLAPLLLFAAAGYASIQPWVTARLPDHHISRFIGQNSLQIAGVLEGPAWMDEMRRKFDVRVDTLEDGRGIHPVSGLLRVTVEGGMPAPETGDRICIRGKILPFQNFKNPGGFDYRRFMAYNGISGSVFVSEEQVEITPGHINRFHRWIERIRSTLSRNLDALGEGDAAAVLKALLIGDRTCVSDRVTDDFGRAGVSHLLAISGLHIGIVATVSFMIFRWFLAWFPPILRRAWTHKGAALLSVIPVAGYGLISGMSPSTQRAVIMVAIFLMTFLVHREHEPFNTLATAALMILILHPPSLFSISFQLSFASVWAIFYFLPRFRMAAGKAGSVRMRILQYGATSFWLSLSATLGVLPLVMYYFNQISLISPLANLILIPLVGSIAVPFGLFFAAASLFFPAVSKWGLERCEALIKFALHVADFLAHIPFAAIKTITPSLLELFCAYVLMAALVALKPKPVSDMALLWTLALPNRPGPSPGAKKILQAAAAATAFVLCLDGLYWGYQRFLRSDFRVTVLDVGQGAANLLEFPRGPVMLIDAGGFSNASAFDMGKMVVAPFLWRKKIRTVDVLVLSHADSDHVNGMPFIAEHFHVKAVWTNTESEESQGYRRLMEVLREKGLSPPDFETLPRHYEFNGVAMDLLHPPADFIKRREAEPWRDVNNNSLVVRARFGTVAMLFPGDIKSDAEKEITGMYGKELQSRILVAPHHGSRTSNSAGFAETVSPQVVIFSTGLNNRFNFPHPSVIKRYRDMGAVLFNTATGGAIQIVTDGASLNAIPFHSSKYGENHGNF